MKTSGQGNEQTLGLKRPVKGTTNIELVELAKCLLIPNFYCIYKDEFKSVQTISDLATNIIVNLNDLDKNINGHWCLCFMDSQQNIYYSSYGDPIPLEVKKFMMEVDDRLVLSSNFQIQDFNEVMWFILYYNSIFLKR